MSRIYAAIALIIWCFVVPPFYSYAHIPEDNHHKFTENKGQWHSNVLFKSDLKSGALFLEKGRLNYNFLDGRLMQHANEESFKNKDLPMAGHVIFVNFLNARLNSIVSSKYPKRGTVNYFLGNDKSKWKSGVKNYGEVDYKELYKGVDFRIYPYDDGLKYDFIVAPNADSKQIKLEYEGADKIELKKGDLIVTTSVNEIMESTPFCYQLVNENRVEVPSKFVLNGNVLSFEFPEGYDKTKELIIDPSLMFATYSGSVSNNFGYTATFDGAGYGYAGSTAFGVNYITTPGAYSENFNGGTVDIALTKYDTTGQFQVWSTYVGGTSSEIPHSMFVNSKNELYVLGTTGSADFPITANAFDSTFGGGPAVSLIGLGASYSAGADMVVFRISEAGDKLLSSTYLGGSDSDGINNDYNLKYNYADEIRGELMIDKFDNVFIASCTRSYDFPIVGNVIQATKNFGLDACIIKMRPDLSTIAWSTFLGGSKGDAAYSLAIDADANVYVAGGTASLDFPASANAHQINYAGGRADGFITKLSNKGALFNSTYYGSTAYDQIYFIKLNPMSEVHVYGQTEISNSTFIKNAAFANPGSGQFISKLTSTVSSVIWSTVFGTGSGVPDISPTAFMVDLCSKIYVSGWGGEVNNLSFLNNNAGYTTGLPITSNAIQSNTDGSDFYMMVLQDDASALIYGTFYGGGISPEHVDGGTSRFDSKGKIYQSVCAGCQGNSDFPTTPGAFSSINGANGCNNAIVKIDFKLPLITADFNYIRPIKGCGPFEVTFINQSLDQGAANYHWDYGDGSPVDFTTDSIHFFADTGTYLITLFAEDTLSCNLRDTAYLSLHIDVPPNLSPNFTTSTVNCEDKPPFLVSFTNLSSLENFGNYVWNYGDNSPSDTLFQGVHFFPDSGVFNVTMVAVDTVFCNRLDTIVKQINIIPRISTISNFTISTTNSCDTMYIFTTNNSTGTDLKYIWKFGDGNVSPEFEPTHFYTDTGSFSVSLIIFDTFCNKLDTSIQIVQHNFTLPFSAGFTESFVPACNTVNITVVDTTIGNNLVPHWIFDNFIAVNNTTTASNTFLINPTYDVMLVVQDTVCMLTDTMIKNLDFNLDTAVVADFSYTSSVVCFDLAVDFINQSQGNSLSYSWSFANGQTSSAATPSTTYSDTNIYNVQLIIYDTLCNLRDTIVKPLLYEPDSVPVIAFLSANKPVGCKPFQVQFNNLSLNPLTSTYNWDFGDGTSAGNSFGGTHTYNDTGSYQIVLIAKDTATCITQDTVSIFLNIHKKKTIMPNFEMSNTSCEMQAPFFISFNNLSDVTPYANYSWSFGDNSISNTSTNPNHFYNTTGIFNVNLIVQDDSACNVLDSIIIPINVQPRAIPIPNFSVTTTTSCDTLYIITTNSSTGVSLNYQWLIDSNLSSVDSNTTLSTNIPGIHTIELIITDSICGVSNTAQQTINFNFENPLNAGFTSGFNLDCNELTLNVSDTTSGNNLNNFWLFGSNNVMLTGTNASFTFPISANYPVTLIAIDTVCLFKDTVKAEFIFNFDSLVQGGFTTKDTIICNRLDVAVTNFSSGNNLTYNWDFGNGNTSILANPQVEYQDTGVYPITLIVADASCGFADTISQTISFFNQPYDIGAKFTTFQNKLCKYEVGTINASTGNNLTYQWSFGDTTFTTENVIYEFGSSGNKNIALVIIDTVCNIIDTAKTTVEPKGIILEPNIGPNQFLCFNDSIITLNAGIVGVESYKWSNGDSTLFTVIKTAGSYTVEVKDSTCIATDEVLIEDAPFRKSLTQTQLICEGKNNEITLINDATGIYLWETGDSTQTIILNQLGSYKFEFVDAYDCKTVDTLFIESKDLAEGIWLPNAFTPNDDQLNDAFIPVLTEASGVSLKIFNRWGQTVYSTSNVAAGWNGTGGIDKNTPHKTEVFIYEVIYTTECTNKKPRRKVGSVTLLK